MKFSLYILVAICLLQSCTTIKNMFTGGDYSLDETSQKGLYHATLKNGLEAFIIEDHTTPLVTIRITFRAGGLVETPDLNGLCHLYEHMLFKGNELYRTQEEFKAALKRLGTGNWNGGTNAEYVTYYFTIPASRLAEGLKFWAFAVKSPLLEEKEFEVEKKVVYTEIEGSQSSPSYPLRKAIRESMYYKYPSRRDVGGDLKVIKNSTIEQMHFIKNNFYIPNNAAIFVAGDIEKSKTLALINQYFGNWKKGADPYKNPLPKHPPLLKNKDLAVATSPHKGTAYFFMKFRGPDAKYDTEATYAADIFGQIINDPNSSLKNNLKKKVPELFGDTRYVNGGYYTQSEGGETYFQLRLKTGKKINLKDAVKRSKSVILDEIKSMLADGYFTDEHIELAKRKLSNYEYYSRETSTKFLESLSFWWSSTSTDYYLNYLEKINDVTTSDLKALIKKYLYKNHFVTAVWLNSDDEKIHKLKN